MKISKNKTLFSALLGAAFCLPAPSALAATTCQAGASPRHSCTAHGIEAPSPQLNTAAPLWEGHTIAFTLGNISDVDHCCVNGPYVDYAEDDFTVDWVVQRFQNGDWEVIDVLSNSSKTAAYWDSSNYYAAAPASVAQYRMMVEINDTPESGNAKGNDDEVKKFSTSFTLWAPRITGWRQVGPAAKDTKFNRDGSWTTVDGCITFTYNWYSTCGHLDHLDNVAYREKVQYDVADSPLHNSSHDNNIFISTPPNPTRLGDVATGGAAIDSHSPFAISTNRRSSYCYAIQKYQQAYQYDGVPDFANDTVPAPWPQWVDMGSNYSIQRFVEVSNGQWRYRINKDNEESTWILP